MPFSETPSILIHRCHPRGHFYQHDLLMNNQLNYKCINQKFMKGLMLSRLTLVWSLPLFRRLVHCRFLDHRGGDTGIKIRKIIKND